MSQSSVIPWSLARGIGLIFVCAATILEVQVTLCENVFHVMSFLFTPLLSIVFVMANTEHHSKRRRSRGRSMDIGSNARLKAAFITKLECDQLVVMGMAIFATTSSGSYVLFTCLMAQWSSTLHLFK